MHHRLAGRWGRGLNPTPGSMDPAMYLLQDATMLVYRRRVYEVSAIS